MRITHSARLVLLVIVMLVTGCSGSGAECKVTMDGDGFLDIIINPPGESDRSEEKGELTRQTSISASGGSTESVTTFTGEIEKVYSDSGATYVIDVFIEISDEDIQDYKLEVTGGVYGDSPHTCTK